MCICPDVKFRYILIVWVANETLKSIFFFIKKNNKKVFGKKRYKQQIFHVTWCVEMNFIVKLYLGVRIHMKTLTNMFLWKICRYLGSIHNQSKLHEICSHSITINMHKDSSTFSSLLKITLPIVVCRNRNNSLIGNSTQDVGKMLS